MLGEVAIHKVLLRKNTTQLAMSSDAPFASGYIAQIMEEDGRRDATEHLLEGTLEWDPGGKSSLEASDEMYLFLQSL